MCSTFSFFSEPSTKLMEAFFGVNETDIIQADFFETTYDENGLIGEGTHERFIIDIERFQNKADAKKM